MSPLNYSKWDNIEDSDKEDDNASAVASSSGFVPLHHDHYSPVFGNKPLPELDSLDIHELGLTQEEILQRTLIAHVSKPRPPVDTSEVIDIDKLDLLDLARLDHAEEVLLAQVAEQDAEIARLREEDEAALQAALPKVQERTAAMINTQTELNKLSKELAEAARFASESTATMRAAFETRDRALQQQKIAEELQNLEQCASDIADALARGDFPAAVARVAPLAKALDVEESDSTAPAAATDAATAGRAAAAAAAAAVAEPPATNEGKRAAEVVSSLRTRISAELAKVGEGGSDVGAICSLAKLTGPIGRAHEGEREGGRPVECESAARVRITPALALSLPSTRLCPALSPPLHCLIHAPKPTRVHFWQAVLPCSPSLCGSSTRPQRRRRHRPASRPRPSRPPPRPPWVGCCSAVRRCSSRLTLR